MSTIATRFPVSHSLLARPEPANINNDKNKFANFSHPEHTGSF